MLNNSSNLYGSEWLALVFRNRNQSYGAYVLRSESSNTLLKAMMIVAPFFIMLFVGPMIYSQIKKDSSSEIIKDRVVKFTDVSVHELKKPEPKKEQQEKPAKSIAAPVQQQVKATAFTNKIEIVDDPAIEPPTSIQLQNTAVSSSTQDGIQSANIAAPVGNTVGGTGISTDGAVSGTEVYDAGGVEVFPEFPGGMEAWSKFILKNLRYPYAAQDAGVQGKVYVSFVVEKDGSITDVKVVKGIGYGCDDEAVRVIKKSPKWKPGQQNKSNVRVRYNMPINYMMTQN